MPNAIYDPESCIRTTLKAARQFCFPLDKLVFEFTETERVKSTTHLQNIVNHYKLRGFLTAIDDFGAGYSGLNLIADVEVDIIKIDMELIRDIDKLKKKQIIVSGIVTTFQRLGSKVIAEGVETREELETLKSLGIELFQGYFIGKPAFEKLEAFSKLNT